MSASIAEVVLSTCELGYQPMTTPSPIPPPVARARRQGPLVSVQRLEEDIAQRQQALTALQAARDAEQKSLQAARLELTALKARLQRLDLSVAEKNQTALELLTTLDQMQVVRARIAERAQRIAQQAVVEPETRGQPAANPAERRAHVRTPVVTEVSITSESNFYAGFTQDISKGGLFIATPDTRPMGTRFLLECKLPETSVAIHCMAEVTWVREYHEGMSYELGAVPGMGVKFVGLTVEDAASIASFQATREALFFPDGSEGC